MMVTFRSARSRLSLLFAVMLTFSLLWFLSNPQDTVVAAQSNFVGGDPSRPDSTDIRALRLRFEAGSRSNWHSHANWQILMAEEGRGQTQERGQDIQDLLPGHPIYTGPNVVHWHGAAPNEHMVQLTFVSGQTSWQDPVSDEEYHGR